MIPNDWYLLLNFKENKLKLDTYFPNLRHRNLAFEDLKAAAERMGKKIIRQRSRMQGYGKRPLHIVDLRKLNISEKTSFKQNMIDAIGTSKDLVFVNEEAKS